MWTTIDPVCFTEVGKETGPLFLWVGVMPGTLCRDDAKDAAVECKKILAESQITDVEIAFRDSVFTRSAGPQLLNCVSSVDPTTSIAARATPEFEGTGGVYLREGGESERIFLLTARHVVLPPSARRNELYIRRNNSKPRCEVILLGSKAYQEVLESTMGEMRLQAILVDYYRDDLQGLGEAVEGEEDAQASAQRKYEGLLKEAENSIDTIDNFHDEITKHWTAVSQRVLGHIVHSPPISVGTGPKRFTEDWALIELYGEKIDWKSFKGNVIDLGTKISPGDFMFKMYPDPTACTSFKYPLGRLLQLRDAFKEDELHHPTMLDVNGEECIIVVKNSNATGVALGRASGIESFVREYDGYDIGSTSMEVAIYPYSHKDGAFSAPGDSGSIIADGKGGIVGLLTDGAGQTDSIDVTYASPYHWVEKRIKEAFPNIHLHPIMA